MSWHEVTQAAAHPVRGRLDRRAGPLHHGVAGALAVDPGDDVRARGGADVDQEAVPGLTGQLGERQVESGACAGARAHRRAEARLTRLGAVTAMMNAPSRRAAYREPGWPRRGQER